MCSSDLQIWDKLPKETRDYVPLMIAAARIGKDPVAHGFGDVVPDGPEVFDELIAEPGVTLAELARRAEVPLQALLDLNPHLVQKKTPEGPRYAVRVPVGSSTRVAGALDRLALKRAAAPRPEAPRPAASTVAQADVREAEETPAPWAHDRWAEAAKKRATQR